MPKELYDDITIYGQTVKESLESGEKPSAVPDDLISLVMGGALRDTEKKKGGRFSHVPLVDGEQYGFLTLHKQVKDHAAGKVRYQCECKCGETSMLPRREIQSRARMRAGCLGFDCPYGPDEVKAWHNPKFSLWLQLMSLLKHDPAGVNNTWGGRAYEGIELVSTDEGFLRMYEDVLPLVQVDKGRWWVHRKNPILPYSLFNIEMGDEPEANVLGTAARYISYGGVLYSVDELAALFGVPLRLIKRWRRDVASDKKLMEIIMVEASK